ncbi:MAG: hypothetical protein AMXMBFR61_11340 [Fimbriimonadales bacterium]
MRVLAVLALSLALLGVVISQGKNSAGEPTEVKWITKLDEGLKLAKSQNKPVLVDFAAEWCGPCQRMLKGTYKDPSVVKKSASFVMVLIDIDQQQDLARKHKVEAVPTLLFLHPDGTQISRAVGYKDAKQLTEMMDSALRAAAKRK